MPVDFTLPERARGGFAAEVFPEGAAFVVVEVCGDEVEDGARGDDDELAPWARDGDGEAARLEQEAALARGELAVGDRGRDDDEVTLAALKTFDRINRVGERRTARGEQGLLRAVRDDDA